MLDTHPSWLKNRRLFRKGAGAATVVALPWRGRADENEALS